MVKSTGKIKVKILLLIDQETLGRLPMQGFTLYCAGEIDDTGQLNISARTKEMMEVDSTQFVMSTEHEDPRATL